MKKGLILMGFGLLVLSSCVKAHNCECVTTYQDGTATTTENITITARKKTAKTLCDSYDYTFTGYYTEECELK
jgi:PBP1b-binding outer membrane lipoprotein LpoB